MRVTQKNIPRNHLRKVFVCVKNPDSFLFTFMLFRMASRPIREVQGLNIIYKHINQDKNENGGIEPVKYFSIENQNDLDTATSNYPWILEEVCKRNILHIL